ncbi:hypothetical protein D3C77_636320 [compost metagenome]
MNIDACRILIIIGIKAVINNLQLWFDNQLECRKRLQGIAGFQRGAKAGAVIILLALGIGHAVVKPGILQPGIHIRPRMLFLILIPGAVSADRIAVDFTFG